MNTNFSNLWFDRPGIEPQSTVSVAFSTQLLIRELSPVKSYEFIILFINV